MSVQMQLDDFFVTRLQIDWRLPNRKTVDVDTLSSTFDYDVSVHAEDATRYKLDLRLKFSEVGKQQSAVGYAIEADLAGIFSFPPESDLGTRQKLARINGVSILYSSFRGILCGITGMFPGGKLTLPSIMPIQIVQQVEEKKQARAVMPATDSPKKKTSRRK